MKKVITWIDPQGRYRVTSPAYGDPTNPPGETEDETIARVLIRIKVRYGLPDNHPFNFVEDAEQRIRVAELAGTVFRYGVFDTDARAGAWEMDTDGLPKVNMSKARVVKTDMIRVERNTRFAVLDVDYIRADEPPSDIAKIAEKDRILAVRKRLRDLPVTIQPDLDAITTPKALEAWQPSWPE